MKKLSLFIISTMMLIGLSIFTTVEASTQGVSMVPSSTTVYAGDTVTFTVNALEDIESFELAFSGITDESAKIVSNPYSADGTFESLINYYQMSNIQTIEAGSNLLQFTYTVDEKAEVGEKITVGLKAQIAMGTNISQYSTNVELTVAEKSTNNNLTMIRINDVNIVDFDQDVLEYYVEADTTAQIQVFKEHPNATVTGEGTFSLPVGTTPYEITVVSQSGAAKVYTVYVTNTAEEVAQEGEANQGASTDNEAAGSDELDETPNTGEVAMLSISIIAVVSILVAVILKK